MYVRGYLQGNENGRVVTIAWKLATLITRRNFGWFRTFIIPRPYYDSSHWNYFRKSSMKEVLK